MPRGGGRRRGRRGAVGGGVSGTVDLQVSASADDAFQTSTDTVSLVAATMITDSMLEHVGLRWLNVTVPAGATIDVAHVTLFIRSTDNDEPKHQIRGELTADPGTFTTTSNDIDARGRTTATVNWDSLDLGAAEEEEWEWGASSPGEGNGANLKDIVQEIIDQGGWNSGQAMVMIYEQHTASDANRDLGIRAWDRAPTGTLAAKLHIEHTT